MWDNYKQNASRASDLERKILCKKKYFKMIAILTFWNNFSSKTVFFIIKSKDKRNTKHYIFLKSLIMYLLTIQIKMLTCGIRQIQQLLLIAFAGQKILKYLLKIDNNRFII